MSIAHRRANADAAAGDGTDATARLYSRLLHVQIDLQEVDDDEAEDILTEMLDQFVRLLG